MKHSLTALLLTLALFCCKLWQVQGVSWTLRSKEDHDTALKEGWLSIFEGFRP